MSITDEISLIVKIINQFKTFIQIQINNPVIIGKMLFLIFFLNVPIDIFK